MRTLIHKFVEKIPEELEDGVIYISIKYATAIHKCFCGCGNEIVTPLSPTQWSLHYNGETVSISPSIGNWSLKCRSHYIIENNTIIWLKSYNSKEIEEVRKIDFDDNLEYFENKPEKTNLKTAKRKSIWKLFFRK